MIKISPSILACDLARMAEEVNSIFDAGADMAHIDVMDGVFVPNISFGIPIVESLRKHTDIFFDVHLMIVNPEKYIERFIDAGADMITFHLEATNEVDACISLIKSRNKRVGISIKPQTPIESLFPYLEKCDMVLIMTVEPGFGGQSLMPECLEKVKNLRDEVKKRNYTLDIQVDGGINSYNSKLAIECGANILVAGSSVFKEKDKRAIINALRSSS